MDQSRFQVGRACRACLVPAMLLMWCGVGCVPPNGGSEPRGHLQFARPRLPPVPPLVPTPIDPALQQKAKDEIATAFVSKDPITRAQALEATSRTKDPSAATRVARGLVDSAWPVRFAAAMCAGDLKLKDTYPALVATASDPEPSVRVAALYALHQLGDKSRTKQLEDLSTNPDARVRANVAMVVGLLNEPTGVRLLRPLLADPDLGVRMQTAGSLWRLKDEQGLKNLIAATISPFPDDQIDGVLHLASPRDPAIKDNILGKLAISKDGKDYVELQLAAARALGMIDSDAGYGLALKETANRERVRRIMAAVALGEIGRPDAQEALSKLIVDPQADVRLAAATALRQIGNRAK
jgi:HEAT repeat protein